jgi:hypothetical protein
MENKDKTYSGNQAMTALILIEEVFTVRQGFQDAIAPMADYIKLGHIQEGWGIYGLRQYCLDLAIVIEEGAYLALDKYGDKCTFLTANMWDWDICPVFLHLDATHPHRGGDEPTIDITPLQVMKVFAEKSGIEI